MKTKTILTRLQSRFIVAVGVCTLFLFAILTVSINAQEHPKEHPKGKSNQLTIQELSEAVKNYVEKKTGDNKGYFLVEDDQQNKALKLIFWKVKDDGLSGLGNDEYFVCADFQAADSTVYDVDIFMKGTNKNDLTATETKVHKVNGKPRYAWYEEKGVWKTKKMILKNKTYRGGGHIFDI